MSPAALGLRSAPAATAAAGRSRGTGGPPQATAPLGQRGRAAGGSPGPSSAAWSSSLRSGGQPGASLPCYLRRTHPA